MDNINNHNNNYLNNTNRITTFNNNEDYNKNNINLKSNSLYNDSNKYILNSYTLGYNLDTNSFDKKKDCHTNFQSNSNNFNTSNIKSIDLINDKENLKNNISNNINNNLDNTLTNTSNVNNGNLNLNIVKEDICEILCNELRNNKTDLNLKTISFYKDIFNNLTSNNNCIRELEKKICCKASKSELNTGLSIKSNITDTIRSYNELNTKLETKANIDDINRFISFKDVNNVIEALNINSINNDIKFIKDFLDDNIIDTLNELTKKVNNIEDTLIKKNLNNCKLNDNNNSDNVEFEISNIYKELDKKANIDELNALTNNKANKAYVLEAIHRKADKEELSKIEGELKKSFDNMFKDINNILDDRFKKDKEEITLNISEIIKDKNKEYLSTGINNNIDKLSYDVNILNNKYNAILNDINNNSNKINENKNYITLYVEKIEDKLNVLNNEYLDLFNNKKDLSSSIKNINTKITSIQNETDKLIENINKDMQFINKSFISFSDENKSLNNKLKNFEENFNNFIELNLQNICNVKKEILNKAKCNDNDFKNILNNMNNKITAIENTFSESISKSSQSTISALDILSDKIQNEEKKIKDLKDNINKTNSYVSDKISSLENLYSNSKYITTIEYDIQVSNFKKEINTLINNKINDVYNKDTKDLVENYVRDIIEETEELRKCFNENKDKLTVLNDKILSFADKEYVNKTVNNNIDDIVINELKILDNKINNKLDITEFENHIESYDSLINKNVNKQNLSNDLNDKNNINNDLINIVNTKADIEDVNKALKNIYNELDSKLNIEEINEELEFIKNNIDNINKLETYDNNNKCILISKLSNLKNGIAFMWNSLISNDNYITSNNSSFIEITSCGYYFLKLKIICDLNFNNKDENKKHLQYIQILVNGNIYNTHYLSNLKLPDLNYNTSESALKFNYGNNKEPLKVSTNKEIHNSLNQTTYMSNFITINSVIKINSKSKVSFLVNSNCNLKYNTIEDSIVILKIKKLNYNYQNNQ